MPLIFVTYSCACAPWMNEIFFFNFFRVDFSKEMEPLIFLFLLLLNSIWGKNFLHLLNDQSTREKNTMKKWYIRKVHEKWSIFYFYGNPWIVIVAEKIAFEVGDFWILHITTKTWKIICLWINQSCVLARNFKIFFGSFRKSMKDGKTF
jgi:hypothetical protein